MSNINSHIAANIKGLQNPITFDSGTAGDDNKGAVGQLIDLLSLEATQPGTEHRLFLDEMSPACRDSLLVILTALQTAIVDAA